MYPCISVLKLTQETNNNTTFDQFMCACPHSHGIVQTEAPDAWSDEQLTQSSPIQANTKNMTDHDDVTQKEETESERDKEMLLGCCRSPCPCAHLPN
jgi:hypothetical protein